MSGIDSSELKREFIKSKTGLVGIAILSGLFIISLVAATTIPIDTFKQWNNPNNWISYPKASMPIWVNYFLEDKIPMPIRPVLLLINSRLSSDESILLILFSPLGQSSHKVNLQQKY